ncbi:sigma 54-interacting transcriptional regulator [Cytobacillus sp. S13-E01]|uniref:sigma 54-interacting transcriptional regulator n=1 Tax=Cytobacillus sp. S13-E01 TaxID=3031326 RepID=UPI0023D80B7A|nr:sigma 54-interacting transcriptional regulator [Cytobacillus sp. S13-E01]MDF0726528.1 sigma 54-interacting transcriptional regulator [Cytobacillus sp. S13-E01]
MSLKKVHIIAIQERYLDAITKQVKEVLGDKIMIQPTSLKDLHGDTVIAGDIVILSNEMIKGLVIQLIPKDCQWIIGKRDINFANTKELLKLPQGKTILVVNDTNTNTEETIQSLRETVFEHHYISYSPDKEIPESIDYIITPGEKHLLPRGFEKVIDIGSRLLDLDTFDQLLNLLGLEHYRPQMIKRYFKSLVSLSIDNTGELSLKTNSVRDIRDVAQYRFDDIVAVSKPMQEIVTLATSFSKTEKLIHIEGESGTGKSMLAQAIHNNSNFSSGPFVTINCSTRDFSMIEKELFGTVENDEISIGLLELAKHGTIYIEEIGVLPILFQGRIYQALQEKIFYRVGGQTPIPLRVRVITSNTKNVMELVNDGKFRQDLYYSMSMFSLTVPTLAERKEDFIPLIEDIKARLKRTNIHFTQEVMDIFLNYNWAGNVKELYNVITYLSFIGEQIIKIESLPINLRSRQKSEEFESIISSETRRKEIIEKIEEHGFLDESIEILKIYNDGKKERTSFGRLTIKKYLEEKGINLTEQQLRIRLEILQQLGLLIVRQGRAGSTISRSGEDFLYSLGTF